MQYNEGQSSQRLHAACGGGTGEAASVGAGDFRRLQPQHVTFSRTKNALWAEVVEILIALFSPYAWILMQEGVQPQGVPSGRRSPQG